MVATMTSRVIATSTAIRITRGDIVEVVTGQYDGLTGEVICAFKGRVTVLGASSRAVLLPLAEVKKKEVAIVSSDLETTQ